MVHFVLEQPGLQVRQTELNLRSSLVYCLHDDTPGSRNLGLHAGEGQASFPSHLKILAPLHDLRVEQKADFIANADNRCPRGQAYLIRSETQSLDSAERGTQRIRCRTSLGTPGNHGPRRAPQHRIGIG